MTALYVRVVISMKIPKYLHIFRKEIKKNLSIAVNFEKKFYSYRKPFELIYKYE